MGEMETSAAFRETVFQKITSMAQVRVLYIYGKRVNGPSRMWISIASLTRSVIDIRVKHARYWNYHRIFEEKDPFNKLGINS